MGRRILIHTSCFLVGGSIGMVVAYFVHEMGVQPVVIAAIVAAFIFLSQVLAHVLSERVKKVTTVLLREPLIRGTEPWGWLKPASGIGAGFPLNKECIRLGRGVDMDILLNNASISRRHAQLRRLLDGCLLEDIGSRNGIFVNGTRVTEQTLNDGDQVGIGEMKFVFHRMGKASEKDEDGGRAWKSGDVRGPSKPTVGKGADESDAARRNGADARPFDDTSEFSDQYDDDDVHDRD